MEIASIDELLDRVSKNEKTLTGKHPSQCCNRPTVIVRSREGGAVTQNCSECGSRQYIWQDEIPPVQCSKCKVVLELDQRERPPQPGKKDKRGSYFYACPICHGQWDVASLVPPWSAHFEQCGVYFPSEKRLGKIN